MKSTGCFLITILSLFMTLFCLLFLFFGGIGTHYYLVKANLVNIETSINYISFTPVEYCVNNVVTNHISCHSNIDYIENIVFSKTEIESIQNDIKKYFVDITTSWIKYCPYIQILFYTLFGILSLAILFSLLTFTNYKFISYACIITGSVFVLITPLCVVVLVSFIKISNYIDSSNISNYITLDYMNSIYGLCIILFLLLCSFIFLVTIRKDEYTRHESRKVRQNQVQNQQQNQNYNYSDTVVVELEKNQQYTIEEEQTTQKEPENQICEENPDYIYLPSGAELVVNNIELNRANTHYNNGITYNPLRVVNS